MLKIRDLQRFNRLLPALLTRYQVSLECTLRNLALPGAISSGNLQLQQLRCFNAGAVLHKYNKKSSMDEDDSDDDEPEFKDERDSKVLKTKVNSLRADLLLRAGLGVARNKIEVIFYESKIRVNGKKLAKKSEQLNVGDEIDIIKGYSPVNPAHLVIARVVVLSANEREDGLSVVLRRYKTLIIENYAGINAFKSSSISPH